MNHLLQYSELSNQYFAMRHGHSLANKEGIVVSRPENGINNYGLSEKGIIQVKDSISQSSKLGSNTIIVCSDFKRTRETGKIVHTLLSCKQNVCCDVRLRERHFGDIELCPDSNYLTVWQEDENNSDNQKGGVESPNQVMSRVSELIVEYEGLYSGINVLLVSHGDALQILQTAFLKKEACMQRYQKHLETAEIRKLIIQK